MLEEGDSRQLANETLDEQFTAHYAGEDEFSLAVQNLIQIHGGGRDEPIRQLVLQLHHYSQARPDAAGWLARQRANFSAAEPADWQRWLPEGIANWRDEWLPRVEKPRRAGPERNQSRRIGGYFVPLGQHLAGQIHPGDRSAPPPMLAQIIAADDNWPAKRKTVLRKPLEELFDGGAISPVAGGGEARRGSTGGRLVLDSRPDGNAAAVGGGIRRHNWPNANTPTASWIFTISNSSRCDCCGIFPPASPPPWRQPGAPS